MNTTTTDHVQATPSENPNRALWEKGDFTRLALTMRKSGDSLVSRLGVGKGTRVLDLGCGDGTTAIPAAQRGADVLGVDIARNLVAAGNARAQALGLANCTFVTGDACNLQPIEDASFDLTVSIFGAMFAPRPMDVAKEMVRVTRPGGRIVMGNWIPNNPTLVAQVLELASRYVPPPPPGFVSPMTWGVPANVTDRFRVAGIDEARITCARETYLFEHEGPAKEVADIFLRYYGPTMNALEAAERSGRGEELRAAMERLFETNNAATDGTTKIPATYLRVTVKR